MKRFYTSVSIKDTASGYNILLDGKPVRTPDRHELETPTLPLAEALRDEWERQVDAIMPASMPLTQWVGTTIDRVRPNRSQHETLLQDYLDSDLLCYRVAAEGENTVMGEAQATHWDPILTWFQTQHHLQVVTTTELAPIKQSSDKHAWLEKLLKSVTDAQMAVLLVITQETGSILLGLAFLQNALPNEAIFAAANVEEQVKYAQYHEDIYGSAPDQERRELQLRNDLESARHYLTLLQQ